MNESMYKLLFLGAVMNLSNREISGKNFITKGKICEARCITQVESRYCEITKPSSFFLESIKDKEHPGIIMFT